MTTRESAALAEHEPVLGLFGGRAGIVGCACLSARDYRAAGHSAGQAGWRTHLAAVLAALDTTPQPALGDDEGAALTADERDQLQQAYRRWQVWTVRGAFLDYMAPAVEAILTARAHQPTPPAQAEAVATIERAESMRTQAVMAANWPLFHLMCEVLGDGDDSITARAIADTAAADAGSADTAARMRRMGGD